MEEFRRGSGYKEYGCGGGWVRWGGGGGGGCQRGERARKLRCRGIEMKERIEYVYDACNSSERWLLTHGQWEVSKYYSNEDMRCN